MKGWFKQLVGWGADRVMAMIGAEVVDRIKAIEADNAKMDQAALPAPKLPQITYITDAA